MDAKPLPSRPDLEQYKKQAKALLKAANGDPDAIKVLRDHWSELKDLDDQAVADRIRRYHPRRPERFKLADAQFILARAYGFESWPKFAKHLESLARAQSPVSIFEQAVDAIVDGDASTLRELLAKHPSLIRARSERVHGATLLHYVSANGVENYRQKTPPNAPEVARILLDAGADVNAVADMYGGNATTLALTATSIHPAKAGVAVELMEMFLAAGAWIGERDVNSCLANGRPQAAVFLAEKGAALDLEAACGIGRLDLVRQLFKKEDLDDDGTKAGFMWACEYGKNDVIEFLLDQGLDVGTLHRGMGGLHWANVGGRLETIKLLIRRGAPLEMQNSYGGTALSNAMWAVENSSPIYAWPDPPADWGAILRTLIEAGADINFYPGMKEELEEMLRKM